MSQPIQPAPQYGVATDERPYNVLSIVGFVLSLLGLSIVAIILGHIGLSQVKSRGERGRGFAIAALVIGYVTLAFEILIVILILVAASIAASNGVITTN